MVKRGGVTQLEDLCIHSFQDLMRSLCVAIGDSVTRGGVKKEEEQLDRVEMFTSRLKEYVKTRVVWYLTYKVFNSGLEGVIDALEMKKNQWTMETNMEEFRLQISAMIKLAEVTHLSQLQTLSLENIPKMIHPSIFRNIPEFSQLRKLELGSSNGGRQGSLLNSSLCEGLSMMYNLTYFSLKYNCTDEILTTLTGVCCNALMVLDVELSTRITDKSLYNLLNLTKLRQLMISKTCLTTEGLGQLLMGLPHLVSLPRCDLLCDTLEIMDWDQNVTTQLNIKDFWWSQQYFFHTTQQMEVVAKLCPYMEDIHFMYQDRYTCQLEVLEMFPRLTVLDLYGGDIQVDNIGHLLEQCGPRLARLEFHYVSNIDLSTIVLITKCCQSLKYLNLADCDFQDISSLDPDESDDNLIFHVTQKRQEMELKKQLVPMLDLEEIQITSSVPEHLFVSLLRLCLNIKILHFGINCQLTDSIFDKIFADNKCQYLEELTIKENYNLTIRTVDNILMYCDNIKSILDIDQWSGVNKLLLEELRQNVRMYNLDIKLQEEEMDRRGVSIFQMCKSALKEKYKRGKGVDWFTDE